MLLMKYMKGLLAMVLVKAVKGLLAMLLVKAMKGLSASILLLCQIANVFRHYASSTAYFCLSAYLCKSVI